MPRHSAGGKDRSAVIRRLSRSHVPFLLAAIHAVAGSAPARAQSPPEEVAAWLTGTFDSKDQAVADPSYGNVRLVTVAVPKSRIAEGAPVLYGETAPAGKPDEPTVARFYRIEEAGGRVLIRPFEPKDLAAVRGKWRDPSALALFGPNDLREKSGCTVFLRKTGDHYEGSTEGRRCASARNGALTMTSIVQLWPGLLVSLDRGWDEKGLQAWGPKTGGSRFVKRSDAPPPDDGLAAKLAREPERKPVVSEKTEGTARVAAAEPAASQGQIGLSLLGVPHPRALSAEDLRRMSGAAPATVTFRGAVYSGLSLKDLLRSSGLETEGMAARRVLAPAVIVATGRDGYVAVFSFEEVLSGKAGFLLAFERDGAPLEEPGGPFQIIDVASPTRSVWGVISLEVRFLGSNRRDEAPR